MNRKYVYMILALLLCLTGIRGIIYSVLIPFDRSPDEKHHFQYIKAKHLQLIGASEQESRQTAARLEVTSRYLLYPEMPPGRYNIQQYPNAKLPNPPSALHIYYWVGAKMLQALSLSHIRDEIYVVRGLSVLCGVIVVWLSFLMTRELFPNDLFLLVGVPTCIAFIPQFSAMNGVVNNDKFAEVFVALFFLVIVKMFKNGLHIGYLAACLATISLGILGKRTAVFTILVFLVMLLVYYWRGFPGLRLSVTLAGLLIGLSVGGYFLVLYNDAVYGFIRDNPLGVEVWLPIENMKTLAFYQNLYSAAMIKFYAKFFILIYWSFWGVFGYMDIHLHHFWYVGAALVQLLAIGGLLRWMHETKHVNAEDERWKAKVIYLFIVSICVVVLVLFFRSIVFRPGQPMLAQGRRLFTTILPIGFLTVFGLQRLAAPKYHRVLGALGIIGLLVLDIVSLSNYMLLNFHSRAFWG